MNTPFTHAIRIRPGTMDADVVSEMRRDEYHVADYVRDGDLVIDVGAYIGAFALFVKQICPGARVLCLEPMPSNFAALQGNLGGVHGVIMEQVALVGKLGTVGIYDFGLDASACHSIYNLGIDDAIAVEVQGQTLSQVIHRLGIKHVRFLKLDCQGAEFEIIPSTPHDLLSNIDYIAMEIHRSIAKTGVVLGNIPDHAIKTRRLYRHLMKTHTLVHRNLDDSVQVWGNRNLVSLVTQTRFILRYVCRRIAELCHRYS